MILLVTLRPCSIASAVTSALSRPIIMHSLLLRLILKFVASPKRFIILQASIIAILVPGIKRTASSAKTSAGGDLKVLSGLSTTLRI